MLRFGAYFGLLFGLAAALNGLVLLAYGERALPADGRSRVPALREFFDVLSDSAGAGTGSLIEGAAWMAIGLLLALFCADIIRPFLPRPSEKRNDAPLRDPIDESFVPLARILASLKGLALVAAVAASVAALSFLLLNGA